ncbi:class I SAM-dependent methyltransferase [Streptomyces cyaneofuscatus]|uniref:class I SAM-dependent methyltransferase n=1 Tax=Streptomyces cyaneofuscatus TaxID=66883 RepID=UPI0036DEE375
MNGAEGSTTTTATGHEVRRSGNFLVLVGATGPGPRILRFEGRSWFRFMDRLYSPTPVHQLSPDEVQELCELRLARSGSLIDERLYASVVSALTVTAAAHTGTPGAILDLGTGDGRAVPAYRSVFADSRIYGCDMSAASLRRHDSGTPVVQISGNGPLPFADRTIDLVLAAFVFHFSVPVPLLAELPRILRIGGVLVATVYGPQASSLAGLLRAARLELVGIRQVRGAPGHFVFTAQPAWPEARHVGGA